ncbi:MAG TPA: hypothetical protein VK623_09530 [Flavobacterium sp.]|nr:hypothetical protein [Flavobacterium sp.]
MKTDFKIVSSSDENAVFRSVQRVPQVRQSKKSKAKEKPHQEPQILTTLHYFTEGDVQRLKEIEDDLLKMKYFTVNKSNHFKNISNLLFKFLEIPK